MKRKSTSLLFGAIVAVGSLLLASPAAFAQDTEEAAGLSSSDEAHLYSFFDEYGVEPTIQEDLVDKMNAGHPWESFSPDSDPISSVTSEEQTKIVTIDTYSDGSILVTEVEKPEEFNDGIQPFGVSGCVRTSSGSFAAYWNNCHVKANTGAIEMGFYLNYESIKGVGSKITTFWGRHHYIIGGTLSNHSLYRINDKQVRYAADYQSTLMPIGFNVWVQANLSGVVLSMTHS